MDAKVGDWVVTPRMGKPIEINVLWHHALCVMAQFAKKLGEPASDFEIAAEQVRRSFYKYWNEEAGYCFDVIDGPNGNESSLRPNQLFAISIPMETIDEPALLADQHQCVLDQAGRAHHATARRRDRGDHDNPLRHWRDPAFPEC